MTYWTDDRALDLEQRRLDAAQARAEERIRQQHDGVTGSHWSPADQAAEERAETTGEDTRCRNCRGMFSEHNNSRCPTR